MDAPNKFGASNRSAPADRSPRRIATWAASGVAVPHAFFGTFFRFERKYSPPRGGSPTTRAGVGASSPIGAMGMRLRTHQSWRDNHGNRIPYPLLLRQNWHTPSRAGDFPRGKRSARPALPCPSLSFARTSCHIKTAAPEFLQKRQFFHFLLERLPLTPASHPQRCKKLSSLNSPGIPPPDSRFSRR